MRAAVEKIRHICEQLAAAKGLPDYASTYQKLAKEAEALMENDEGRSDFMEVIYRYRPDQVSRELKREQQERERNVPAA